MNPKIILVIIFIVGIFGYLLFENFYYQNQSSTIQIHGKIEELEYNEKGFPVVTINKNVYFFSFGNDGKLQIGDSLSKVLEESELEVYRNGAYIKSYYGMVTTN